MKKKFILKFIQFFSYFYYTKTRKYFFILVIRKFKKFLFKENSKNKKKWIKENLISHKTFYKINKIKYSNFFLKQKKYFIQAKKKYDLLAVKMGGMADLNLIYNITKKNKPQNILETGVAFGWSTLAFSLSKKKNTKIFSIDLPYPFKNSHNYIAKALPVNLKKNIRFFFGIDTEILNQLYYKKKKFDIIHYDSDKSFEARKKNYEIIWKMLRKNGYFISDDISDNTAFEQFIKKFKIKNFYILQCDGKFVGVASKNS